MVLHVAFFISCVAIASSNGISVTDGYTSNKYDFDQEFPLLHLTLNNREKFVYISAVNRIYQLEKDLSAESLIQVNTGPVNDSGKCLPYGKGLECGPEVLELTDNYNKLFLMDIDRGRILICGSIYQGICEARSLKNIQDTVHHREDNFTAKDYVSCTNPNCTTIGVIAEGPTVFNPVLYVANTIVKTTYKIEEISSISSRSLYIDPAKENKLFRFAVDDDLFKISTAPITEGLFDKYFKYGFSTNGDDGFVYFLFQKFEGKSNKTIISRTCKKDVYFYSYIEMALVCESGDKSGELIGAFYQKKVGLTDFPLQNASEGTLYVMFKTVTGSSLCTYTIQDLNMKFDETIVACYKEGMNDLNGSTIAINHEGDDCDSKEWMNIDATLDNSIIRTPPAPKLKYYPGYELELGKIRCGAYYLPRVLERVPEVSGTWTYHRAGENFTALTVDLVDERINVAYIGTESGNIIELDINHKNNYNTINIGFPILSDLILDEDSSLPVTHLYALTNFTVFHMKVSVCGRHKTCSECLGAKDPYCGWCILQYSCMPKSSECPSIGWLEPLSDQCIKASEPEPLERTLEGNIETKVTLLPALQSSDDYYTCIYNNDIATDAEVDVNDKEHIVCKAPPSDDLPANFDGEDFVNVTLSIRYNDDIDIVSTVATFYECKAHGSTIDKFQPCQSCIVNRWENKCQWCINSHTCLPMDGSCTTQSEECPKVISVAETSKLLPVGLPTEITMNVANIPRTDDADYTCLVDLHGSQSVPALISESGDYIVCQAQSYKYSEESTEVRANVTVFWRKEYIVDTVSYKPVTFYNCSVKFDDCSLCVTSKPEYKCGWCGSMCTIEQTCNDIDNWITDPEMCPAPEIQSFSPTSGPIAGNTLITIKGINMGVSADDVESVTVADVPCDVQKNMYKVSKEIVCKTGAASMKVDNKVSITVRGATKISKDNFHYRNPVLSKVLVQEGPVAGGTMVTIIGENLQTGLTKEAAIGNLPCTVQIPLRNNTVLECKTSPATESLYNLTLSVLFDGFSVEIRNAFSYVENPQIISFTTASKKMASFLAGGRSIVFTGKRLDLVQNAKIIAFVSRRVVNGLFTEKKRKKRNVMQSLAQLMLRGTRSRRAINEHKPVQFPALCSITNATSMICPTPEISRTIGDNVTHNISDSEPVRASLRLLLDNVNIKLRNTTLKYYPNPVVENLEDDQKTDLRNGNLLIIKVHNLNDDAIRESEIEINIGEKRCPVTSINDEGYVHCELPSQPEGETKDFPVTVRMGNKIWEVGSVTYFVVPPVISQAVIYVFIAVGIILLISGIIGAYFCYRKNKHYKENKNDFQKALENLEMSVRADFRKAFAELSIDMTDLTSDIGDVGLPILNYRQYATNMFFQGVRYHPCMKEPDSSTRPIPAVEQGFVQFNLLLTNKHFLLSFVRTLEQQRGFSNRDKGNVASLITVVLHKKLDYFTEVMKSLISELIVASVERNPKLVLRRTESVAERMYSNWMAMCLYPFIRDKAGKPLFLLQKAIKHQVSKGALDAITGKARYTLSDDRLLKEDIPSDLLTLFVSQSDAEEPIIVKVLSCDTISQVKEKVMDAVYKRIPFSLRPKAELLDLEWRHGRSGHLILPGLDYANEPGSRWRRVMTIKDYKVENNATMALIQRQPKYNDVVDQYTNTSPDTSVISPMLPEDNIKIYHLVKYTDDLEQKRESTIPRDRHKHILDLYLLRLINMKGILQSYVDEVFQAILDTSSTPIAVKHFFDFLDDLAKTHNIDDPEILHIWKTNSVLGRFWVTILKTPESVFDIDKPESVESSMAVISQTFIDACSVQEHNPSKDSPINKQLYAKEIPTYKKMVQKYYSDAHDMPAVSEQDMSASMTEISRSHNVEFDVHVAYNELWGYVNKYYEEIHETLANDPNATQMVIQRLQQAYTLIDSSINNP